MSTSQAIPERLNLAIALLAMVLGGLCLFVAAHTPYWLVAVLAAGTFSFVNQTLFSVLHEAVHGIFHNSRHVNNWVGRIAAGWIPTGFGIQRRFHLAHHARNRTEFEQFDYFRPGEIRWLKRAQWYAILTGIYWAFLPLAGITYLIWPGLWRLPLLRSHGAGKQVGAQHMLRGFDDAPVAVLRLEILFSFAIQVGLFLILDLNWRGWLLCYAAFAINWSSLQYADHAFSELDVRNGAWNLKVHPLVRLIFLNYHLHRAHHQHPQVAWLHLPHFVDDEDLQPRFWQVYWQMWRGPRPLPNDHRPTLVIE